MTKDETRLLLIAAALAGLVFWKREEITTIVSDAISGWKGSTNAQRYLPALNAAESAYGIPRDLLARVAYQESRFRDDIVSGQLKSSAGAVGIMQIVPKWHPDVNAYDPLASINYAASYLKSLFKQFGSWQKALAAYNFGPGNLAAGKPLPTETKNYVAQITADVPVV
jgi:Soluble lytic murein transglycosylase and related regulatory proteins (some contain LysM/invasin domains)